MKKPGKRKPNKQRRSRRPAPAAVGARRGAAQTGASRGCGAGLSSARPASSFFSALPGFGFAAKTDATLPTARQMRAGRPVALARGDDRDVLALLMLPVLLVGLAIGIGQTLRPGAARLPALIAHTPAIEAQAPRHVALETPPRALLRVPPQPFSLSGGAPAIPPPNFDVAAESAPLLPAAAQAIAAEVAMPAAPPALPAGPGPVIAEAAVPLPRDGLAALVLGRDAPHIPRETVALAVPELRLAPGQPALSPPPLDGRDDGSAPSVTAENVCFPATPPPRVRPVSWTDGRAPAADPVRFGIDLAEAAKAQTREFVIYNDKYRRIAYPMGDVPSFYGVCTDVLVRAYRELGIDLQELVQRTRIGSGDPNIDHRRVNTLRRFFSVHGKELPITDFAENYRPGDIVSYWRPQNRHSRTHIAIVSNEIGPSGRPMIIHNRGWGPQIEDALFVDQITGHYRFHGLGARSKARTAAKSGAGALRGAVQETASATKPGMGANKQRQSAARREAGAKPASATR